MKAGMDDWAEERLPDLPLGRNLRGPDEIQLWFSPIGRGGNARGYDYLLTLNQLCQIISPRFALLLCTC